MYHLIGKISTHSNLMQRSFSSASGVTNGFLFPFWSFFATQQESLCFDTAIAMSD